MRVVGRYALHHEIAAGGMASVFLGKMSGPVGFSPIVAIKSLHPQFAKDPEFVRMFLDEARLAGRIRHPNIVPVIDVHAEASDLFLVLEYVHGEALGRLVAASRKAGALPSPAIASAVLCDVLQGLHAAHEAKDERGEPLGIVHRDVSPQNVLVGVDGVARVLDFGVAKAAGRVTSTRDGQVKGKFAYMAPEQLRGEGVNRQADVYSAAVVLWEMLTGERLFRAENEGHTVERVLFGVIAPPSALRPELPGALDAVVMRALSRERSARFATAKEMAIALQAAVVPASSPEVGEWVEARALEALELRSGLVKDTEALAVSADAGASSGVETSAPSAAAAPAPRRTPKAVTTVIVGVAAIGAAVLVRTYRTLSAPAAPEGETATVAPATTAAPEATERTAASASSQAEQAPPPAAPAQAERPSAAPAASGAPQASAAPGAAEARPPSPPAVTQRSARPAKRAAKGPAPAASSACTRRNADGEIEFDMECLRGRTP